MPVGVNKGFFQLKNSSAYSVVKENKKVVNHIFLFYLADLLTGWDQFFRLDYGLTFTPFTQSMKAFTAPLASPLTRKRNGRWIL